MACIQAYGVIDASSWDKPNIQSDDFWHYAYVEVKMKTENVRAI